MTTTFENAKVGDKVWCMRSGWGEIRETDWSSRCPIYVVFSRDEFKTYTADGLYDTDDKLQTLFWDEIKFEAPTKPLPKLKVDDKVLVWQEGGESKYKYYFSHFIGDKIYCFNYGATSFSSTKYRTTAWDNFEIYTGE